MKSIRQSKFIKPILITALVILAIFITFIILASTGLLDKIIMGERNVSVEEKKSVTIFINDFFSSSESQNFEQLREKFLDKKIYIELLEDDSKIILISDKKQLFENNEIYNKKIKRKYFIEDMCFTKQIDDISPSDLYCIDLRFDDGKTGSLFLKKEDTYKIFRLRI